MTKQRELLERRYDLTSRPRDDATMLRGKPIQVGPTVKLPAGVTREKLSSLSPEEIRDGELLPSGFLPLPHPKHAVGGIVFSQREIKTLPRLERRDVDFDLPDHYLPEFPPAM